MNNLDMVAAMLQSYNVDVQGMLDAPALVDILPTGPSGAPVPRVFFSRVFFSRALPRCSHFLQFTKHLSSTVYPPFPIH